MITYFKFKRESKINLKYIQLKLTSVIIYNLGKIIIKNKINLNDISYIYNYEKFTLYRLLMNSSRKLDLKLAIREDQLLSNLRLIYIKYNN